MKSTSVRSDVKPHASLDAGTVCGAFQVTAAERPGQSALRAVGGERELLFADFSARVRALAEGLTPGQKGIRLVLPAEGRIEGTVVEKGTENPLAGMEIRAVGSLISGIHHESAKTDKGGHFSMAGMTAGKYGIEIVGKGSALPEWIGSQENLQVDNGKAASVKIMRRIWP